MRARRLAWLLLVVLSMAGCTRLAPVSEPQEALAPAALPDATRAHPAPAPRELLAAQVVAESRWFKPRQSVTLEASAPVEGVWSWYASTNASDVRAQRVQDLVYVEGATGEGTRERSVGEGPRVETGLLPPGLSSPRVVLARERLHEFVTARHPDVVLEVSVALSHMERAAVVALVHDAHGFRFVPERVALALGGSVRFVNEDALPNAVFLHRTWTPLPAERERVALVGVDPGWYEVMARVQDGARVAEGRVGVLVDFDSPSSVALFGPHSGRFGPAEAGVDAWSLAAAHPAREVDVLVRAQSLAGEPRVRVALVEAGGGVREGAPDAQGRVRFVDVPAGEHRLELHLVEGALVDYRVEGLLRLRPEPPAPPAWVSARE